MTGRGVFLAAALALLAGGILVHTGSAQPVRRQVLKSLRVHEMGGCQRITAEFQFPVAVIGHFPADHGPLLLVRVAPFEGDAVVPTDLADREALTPPPGPETPLQQISWEGDAPAGPQLIFRFDRDVAYRVTRGGDFRTVVVTLHPITRDPAPCAGDPPGLTGAPQ